MGSLLHVHFIHCVHFIHSSAGEQFGLFSLFTVGDENHRFTVVLLRAWSWSSVVRNIEFSPSPTKLTESEPPFSQLASVICVLIQVEWHYFRS